MTGAWYSTVIMLRKMAGEWEAMVNTARMRRQAMEIAEKEKERKIQKHEKLEWEQYLRETGEID